jgi:hypothetical protein
LARVHQLVVCAGMSSAPPPRDGADRWQINQVLRLSRDTHLQEVRQRARAIVLAQRHEHRRAARRAPWWQARSGGPDILGHMLALENDDICKRVATDVAAIRAEAAVAAVAAAAVHMRAAHTRRANLAIAGYREALEVCVNREHEMTHPLLFATGDWLEYSREVLRRAQRRLLQCQQVLRLATAVCPPGRGGPRERCCVCYRCGRARLCWRTRYVFSSVRGSLDGRRCPFCHDF